MDTDKMIIVIPTHQRVERQITLRSIPDEWRSRTYLVASTEEEADELTDRYRARVFSAPPYVKTIAQKRKFILEWAHKQGFKKLLMLDDDLRFSRREFTDTPDGGFTFKLVKTTDKDVDWALRIVERKLDSFAHVGIGPRQGNNGLTQHRRWNPNYRMIYALGYRVPTVIKRCKLGRIEHREDMDLCLQLLTQGYANRVLIEVVVDQTYNSPGGASAERKIERSNADADKLASWFPNFVKVVERDYKKSIKRKEVTVAWKKAYQWGAERRERTDRR
jgi:hypothetical protein